MAQGPITLLDGRGESGKVKGPKTCTPYKGTGNNCLVQHDNFFIIIKAVNLDEPPHKIILLKEIPELAYLGPLLLMTHIPLIFLFHRNMASKWKWIWKLMEN